MITTLAQLIALVESNNNPLAVRFEPAHKPEPYFVMHMMELVQCSYATATTLCAMSWGKYQIMGDNLVSLGLTVSPLAYVHDEAMQDAFFEKFAGADHLTLTLQDVLTSPQKRMMFARLYNGPSNIAGYANRIADVAKANDLEVVP